jgi:hypothetical protein
MQYANDPDGLMHTHYDEICTKEYWLELLDKAHAMCASLELRLATFRAPAAHVRLPYAPCAHREERARPPNLCSRWQATTATCKLGRTQAP